MQQDKIIGIIGGMGPYAGLDLVQKVFDQTQASKDQQHLPVALLSYPSLIEDRSDFLFGRTTRNPADAIAPLLLKLERLGAAVAAMPCNTAHAPPIYDRIVQHINEAGGRIRFLHMIEETARFIHLNFPTYRRVGVMATLGTSRLRIYERALEAVDIRPILPDPAIQENDIHLAIYHPRYGIKAHSNPVSEQARNHLLKGIHHLKQKGADAIILGCTELPLAIHEPIIEQLPVLDPTLILARALVRTSNPDKLIAL